MALHLSSNDWRQLLDWSNQAGDHECCGILRGEGNHVVSVELAKNVAAHTTRHFEIDPAVLIAAYKDARKGGLDVVGYFHSHPNGAAAPSATDIANAAPDDLFCLIIAGGGMTAWRPAVLDTRVSGFTPVPLVVEG